MSCQLVVSGNRILSHGEGCFIATGGTVINIDAEQTGGTAVYQNATIINHDGELPADIDRVGYEYHAGQFVPCAPFGEGDGNIAVFCNNDCKSLKDSGIPFSQMIQRATFTYEGDGGKSVVISSDKLPPNFVADLLLIFKNKDYAIITPIFGTVFAYDYDNTTQYYLCDRHNVSNINISSTSISWEGSSSLEARLIMNEKNETYKVMALGHREV